MSHLKIKNIQIIFLILVLVGVILEVKTGFLFKMGSSIIAAGTPGVYPNPILDGKFDNVSITSPITTANAATTLTYQDVGSDVHISGNTGMGTSTPIGKLDIQPGGWNHIPLISFNQTGDNPSMRLYRPTGSGSSAYPWWIEASSSGSLQFKTGTATASGLEALENVPPLVSISKGGNVGIGTISPSSPLDVNGTIRSQGGLLLDTVNQGWIDTAGANWPINIGQTNASYVDLGNGAVHAVRGGNVGIGTTSPLGTLNVSSDLNNGGSRTAQFLIQSTTDPLKRLYMGVNNTNDYASLEYVHEGSQWGPLVLQADGGNVGIGAAPLYKLDVVDSTSVTPLRLSSAGYGQLRFIPYSNNEIYIETGNNDWSASQNLHLTGYNATAMDTLSINANNLCLRDNCVTNLPSGTSTVDIASSSDYYTRAWGDWFSTTINTPRTGGYVIAFATAGMSAGDDGGGIVINYDGVDGNIAYIVGGGSPAKNAISIGIFPAGNSGNHTLKVRAYVGTGTNTDSIGYGKIQAFWLP
ncbi:MAG: hypothetical protein M1142_01055 [Patescibacteria group bacterium]|nr:hypothetical protein [Patescibacteria group bacterium]